MLHDYFREMYGGPGHLRFFVQPAIALLLGVREGVRDRRAGRTPFLLALARHEARLRDGLRVIALPLAVAVAASFLFQYLIRARLRPLPALLYAAVFVALPYLIARALTNRALARRDHRRPPLATQPDLR